MATVEEGGNRDILILPARSTAEIEADLRDIDDFLSGQEHGGELWYNSETGRIVARSRAAPRG
jgi:hypothetical protein